MCYSAQVWADYKRYFRDFGAQLSLKEFFDLFWRRKEDPKVKIPKGMETPFLNPTDEETSQVKALIDEFAGEQATKFEQELFRQRKRLADAERVLASKPTKAAAESQRIAISKIDATLGRLADLRRVEPLDRDARIFPGNYAPLMVLE